MNKSIFHVLNIFLRFHPKQVILVGQCINSNPFFLDCTFMDNLKDDPHFFCRITMRNTKKTHHCQSSSDNIFSFRTIVNLLFFLFSPKISRFVFHNIIIFVITYGLTYFHRQKFNQDVSCLVT